MSAVVLDGWTLVSKRPLGPGGYVFEAKDTAIAGRNAALVKLVVSVVECGAQHVYFREQSPEEHGYETDKPIWLGIALITPLENEELSKVATIGANNYSLEFEAEALDASAQVIVGVFPKISPKTTAAC